MIARAALLLALLAAGHDDPLAGRVAGEPAACIDLDRVQGPEIVGPRTILYRQNARRVWRVEPVGACTRLQPSDALVVEVSGRRLCRDDRFRVRTTGALLGGYCRFGSFTPYDRPAR